MNKRKNVCMFVWNHFTNDARVLRECTALSENNYNVDLVCLEDPTDKTLPLFEERSEHFRVHRVKRYPSLLIKLQKFVVYCKNNKVAGLLALSTYLLLLYLLPLITIGLSILMLLSLKTKFKTLLIRTSIIIRMIKKGFEKNYDIYHSNDLNTLTQGYICAKLRFHKKYLVYDSHEVQTSRTGYNSSIYAKLESFYINKIDIMIVENHTRAKYNKELYGFYPNVVHNYPFNNSEVSLEKINIHELLNLPTQEKILLYQGGIQTGRGLDKLIDAVPYFQEGTLVLIGDGKIKPDLIKKVKNLNLEEKVKFLPKVPLNDLPKYTKNAYIGFQVLNNVCFNHYSASSNKLFEYMMSGVPVVACDFPEIKKVVENEKTGITIDSHNSNEIAEAVNKLLSNVKLRKELSNNSLVASSKYNWDNEKLEFLNIYNNICTKN